MPAFSAKKIIISASITFIILCIHLIGVYIYSGGYYEGVKGGSMSIGIVDTLPNPMNPFSYGENSSSDLLYRFLFRGLIHYDIKSGIYQGDLALCDLTDIMKISCTLSDTAVWSDGTRVKLDDIIKTMEMIGQTTGDSSIAVALKNTKIEKKGEQIQFLSKEKNPKIIDILGYPIVRQDIIEKIQQKTLTKEDYITSGPYTLSEVSHDDEYGFDRITLTRNERWIGPIWLDKIHFKIFKDLVSLERSTETLTVVIPPEKNENLDLGARFHEYLYTNYEYFGVFFNTRTLSRTLRNTLHWQIGTSFSPKNVVEDHKHVDTLFVTGGAPLPTQGIKNFSDVLRGGGYIKKHELLSNLIAQNTTVSGEAPPIETKYWNNKTKTNTLFINEKRDEIILTGKVPPNTKSITINGYTLKEFKEGNTDFVYKVTAASGTLNEGKNIYTLLLTFGNQVQESEVLTLYMSADAAILEKYKKEIQDTYNATLNTPALIAVREREKQEKIIQAQTLQDEYYYNEKNEIFSLKIGYVSGPQSTEQYAGEIEKSLKLLGVKTELIAYGPKEIQNMIKTGEKSYDILVIGVSVEGSRASIGKLFAPANQGGGGDINFSNIENKSLSTLFSELLSTTNPEKIEKIEQNIAKIMNTESFYLPISSPYHRIWVDRNIKGIPKIERIPDTPNFADIFVLTSIKENYILKIENKSISGFFTWLKDSL